MNQDLADTLVDSLVFNKDDFIRLGRTGRRITRDDKDKLVIAGGLGIDI